VRNRHGEGEEQADDARREEGRTKARRASDGPRGREAAESRRGVEGGYAIVRAAANGLVTVSDAQGR
jgi:hypothetical protein